MICLRCKSQTDDFIGSDLGDCFDSATVMWNTRAGMYEEKIKELEAQIEEHKPAWVTSQIRAGNLLKDGDIKTMREQWEENEKFSDSYVTTTRGRSGEGIYVWPKKGE